MAITFALRGGSFTPQKNNDTPGYGTVAGPVTIVANADSDVIGGNVIDCSNGSTVGSRAGLIYTGKKNFTTTGDFSILLRCEFNTFSGNFPLLTIGHCGRDDINFIHVYAVAASNQIRVFMANNAAAIIANALTASHSASDNVQYDYVLTWNNTTKAIKFYADNSALIDTTSTNSFTDFDEDRFPLIALAYGDDLVNGQIKINEFVIWDTVIDPSSITLTGSTAALNGATRSEFVNASQIDASSYTDPGIANVLSGTSYIFAGSTLTGTLTDDYEDPGIANVLSGTSYLFAGSTLTGTLSVPTASAGTSTTLDIPNLKTQLKFVLDQNNTTTSSVHDLSSSLTDRVQRVLTLNPAEIMPQATFFPCVCISTDSKEISLQTSQVNQVAGKREAVVTFNITGLVYNDDVFTSNLDDPARDDIEYLMENVEKILRHYGTLNDNVRVQFPTSIAYDSIIGEEAHMRVGVMQVQAKQLY